MAEKNNYFKIVNYRTLTEEMKKRAILILMLIVAKRNRIIKSRSVAHSRYQHIYMSREKCSSRTPDFYAFKFIYEVIAKEERDIGSADLPEFFLQRDTDDDNDPMLIKLTGAVTLLLIESDRKKWSKHLKRENGKWIIYVLAKKWICSMTKAALKPYKKLAKILKS